MHFYVINEAFSGTSQEEGPGAVKLVASFLVTVSVWYARPGGGHFSRIPGALGDVTFSLLGLRIDDTRKVKEVEEANLF